MTHSSAASLWTQHLLFFFLVIAGPILDHFAVRRLKTSPHPNRKISFYRLSIAVQWILALIACFAAGFLPIYTFAPSRLTQHLWPRFLAEALLAVVLILIFLPIVQIAWNPRIREKSAQAFKPLSFLLPESPSERAWFAALCLTAGICEEVLYRGFLLHYRLLLPFHLGLLLALVLSSIIFGIGHLYQGGSGVISTAILGCLFGLTFLITGNLLAGIVAHAIIDLRVLILLAPAAASGNSGSGSPLSDPAN